MLGNDAMAFVALRPTEEGGRRAPTPPGSFGCILQIDGRNYDVRLQFDRHLVPGTARRVGIVFLDPAATTHLAEGASFTLWEGRDIGMGRLETVSRAEEAVV